MMDWCARFAVLFALTFQRCYCCYEVLFVIVFAFSFSF
jgi:hypothetical protein